MVTAYLWLNAVLYAVLALLCIVRARPAAANIGFTVLGPGGVSEFVTVYGGLQLGLAVFFALCASSPPLLRVGLVFALCLYVPIVVMRAGSAVMSDASTATWSLLALESALMLAAVALWIWQRPL